MAKQAKPEKPKGGKLRPRHYPKCLRGRAAEELRWKFSVGRLGYRQPVPLEEREPEDLVPRKRRIDGLPSLGWNETRYDPRDAEIIDAEKLRRIDEGFAKLDPEHRAWAAVIFVPKRRGPELRAFFGGLENFALVWPTVLEAIEKEREELTKRICDRVLRANKPSPELLESELRRAMALFPDHEAWFTKRLMAIPKFGETIRAEVEAAAAAVVTAYELVRVPTNREKLEVRERKRRKHAPRPRASVVDEFTGAK